MIDDIPVNEITDIGKTMLENGADAASVETSLDRMLRGYGAKETNIIVMPNRIDVSILTRTGNSITQVKKVKSSGFDFETTNALWALSMQACKEHPDAVALREKYEQITSCKCSQFAGTAAFVVGVVAYCVSYGGQAIDALVCGFVCILIMVLFAGQLQKLESNGFVCAFLLTFTSAAIVVIFSKFIPTLHPFKICLGLIVWMFGGLSLTRGIQDIINGDTFSGILNICSATVVSVAIALGIALAFFNMHGTATQADATPQNIWLKIITSGIASSAFAFHKHASRWHALLIGIGTALSVAVYIQIGQTGAGDFICIGLTSMFVAMFSFTAAKLCKVQMNMFLVTIILPFVPGTQLFYMALAIIRQNYSRALSMGQSMAVCCLAIAFGYLAMELVIKNFISFAKLRKSNNEEAQQ